MAIPYQMTPLHRHRAAARPPAPPSNWGPYSSSGDFTANIVIILISLFCALILAIALNVVLRHLFCVLWRERRQRRNGTDIDFEKQESSGHTKANAKEFKAVSYGEGVKMKMTECCICLGEFVDGERVRVLPNCEHGFHVECIGKWLVGARDSCPTCRTTCTPLLPQFWLLYVRSIDHRVRGNIHEILLLLFCILVQTFY